MKRKLSAEAIPTSAMDTNAVEIETPNTKDVSSTTHNLSFSTLGLDSRLLQAIAEENFSSPTPIQEKAIPIALQGKDILARSKTGSGKTAAYVLPVLQSLLDGKGAKISKSTVALILVPTRELAQQVSKAFSKLSVFCSKEIRVINLTQKIPEAVQRSVLAGYPEVVVATPAGAAQSLRNAALSIERLLHLVIDEADLVLSYGYDDDLQAIARAIPQGVQTSLMSATLTTEVDSLRDLFCRAPAILDLQEKASEGRRVSQYAVRCAEDEKFLLVYVIFKLKLIKGKCILFVGDTDRCYRVKLFLEQFGIRSCILNSELPVSSRIHVVEEFNKNVYDIVIAADEHEVLDIHKIASPKLSKNSGGKEIPLNGHNKVIDESLNQDDINMDDHADELVEGVQPAKKVRKRSIKSKEYGVSRGIDFKNVSCILNFDLPTTSKSYTHRIGRTARAGKTGMALSFVVPTELYHKHHSTTISTAQHDEEVFAKIVKDQRKNGTEVKPYHFDMKRVDAFRYRMNDALRAVTRIAIREARTRELREELLKSDKLRRHFEENPDDLHHLRHDGELRTVRIQQHLKHVPDYLMPSNAHQMIAGHDLGFVGLRKTTDNRVRKARAQNRMKGKGKKVTVNKSDPLKTFNAKGRR